MLKKAICGMMTFVLAFSVASSGCFVCAKIDSFPVEKDDMAAVVDFMAENTAASPYLDVLDVERMLVVYFNLSERQKSLVENAEKMTELCETALKNQNTENATVELTVGAIDKIGSQQEYSLAIGEALVYYYLLTNEQKAQVGNAQKLLNTALSLQNEDFFRVGDFDFDGMPKVEDALGVLQIAVGKIRPINMQKRYCDMNGDGEVTVDDALMVLQMQIIFPLLPV